MCLLSQWRLGPLPPRRVPPLLPYRAALGMWDLMVLSPAHPVARQRSAAWWWPSAPSETWRSWTSASASSAWPFAWRHWPVTYFLLRPWASDPASFPVLAGRVWRNELWRSRRLSPSDLPWTHFFLTSFLHGSAEVVIFLLIGGNPSPVATETLGSKQSCPLPETKEMRKTWPYSPTPERSRKSILNVWILVILHYYYIVRTYYK